MQTRDGVTPPFMRGREIVRVGLLLPFSLRPQDAAALYNAAELALFELGNQNTLLIPRDAGADEASANAAARALVTDGADIIIGPVLREGVAGAANARAAQNIPVIGFSSDRTVGGNGVYLLSFQLEDEIARLVSYAASAEHPLDRAAGAVERIRPPRRKRVARRGAGARRHHRRGAALQPHRRRCVRGGDGVGRRAAAHAAQGILIAESGAPLRAIGTALGARRRRSRAQVRFMGTSVWAGEAEREPTLAGGWYVAPDPTARTEFENRYRAAFGEAPTRLASLGYDAVALAALLSRDRGAQGFCARRDREPRRLCRLRRSLPLPRQRRDRARPGDHRSAARTQITVLDAAPRRFPESGT